MIPQGLSYEHFQKAAAKIDDEGVPIHRKSHHYDLVIDGENYPPKYMISMATKIATGFEYSPSKFNAVEAKNYFSAQGYQVIDRRTGFFDPVEEDDESAFPEGERIFKFHARLERDPQISKKAKEKRLTETGELACDVCGFDFSAFYGAHGQGFIEAHHKKPVSTLNGEEKTQISDLALVCSNCHRMLHRGELLSIEALAEKIAK